MTNNLPRRIREHKRRFGFRPDYNILEIGEGDRRECRSSWIEHFRVLGIELENKTEGGDGCQSASLETRAKLSALLKGKQKPDGFGAYLSLKTKNQPRGWTPEGQERVKATQFKKGHRIWETLSPEEKEHRFAELPQRAWEAIPPEERSRRASERVRKMWASMTPEERSVLGQRSRVAATQSHSRGNLSNRNKELTQSSCQTRRKEQGSRQVKDWWASLSPEQKAEFVKRRLQKIMETSVCPNPRKW